MADASSVKVSDSQIHFAADLRRGRQPTFGIWHLPTGEQLALLSGADSARVYGASRGTARTSGHQIQRFEVAQDGSWIAIKTQDGLFAWEDARGARQLKVPDTTRITATGISPDGQSLAVAHDQLIDIYDLTSLTRRHRCRGHTAPVISVAFSPQSTQLASTSEDETLRIWSLDSGAELLNRAQPLARRVAYSPDGKQLVTGSEDGQLRWWNLATGEMYMTEECSKDAILDVAVSPDGQSIVSCGRDRRVILRDMLTGDLRAGLMLHDGEARHVCFRPDGMRIASAGNDGRICIWDASNGALLKSMRESSLDIRGIVYSPDGRRLLSLNEAKINVWDPEAGLKVLEFQSLSSQPSSIHSSGTGALVVADETPTVRIWSWGATGLGAA